MIFKEETLSSEYAYKGRILNVRKDEVTVINGRSTREIVEHIGGVAIAAVNSEGKTDYETAAFAPGANGIVLNDDRIRKHILVDCGFALIPGREYHEISCEELALLGGDDSG